ncbi:hypothetical protein [uncultured Clostridium sp.]|uniref:hypothetical protein n=1 Tax=uncultured Clostridium sp. TaxID=59620 RepID=UPI00267362BB|nr:hypothetical protein [uncultured Clostridium sp.]
MSKIKIELQDENYEIIEKEVEYNEPNIITVDLEGLLKNKYNYSYSCKYYDVNGNELTW